MRSTLRLAPASRVNLAPLRRTSELWTTAQPDATASNRTRHRCQERVQPWQPAMVDSLHISGVVSRVPCSSRAASAHGTDRNTYLTSTHQRQRTESKGNGQTGGQESSESNFVFRPARCNSLVQAREMASLRHRAIAGWCSTRPRAQWRAAGPRRFTLHRHVGDNGECGDTAPRRSLASFAGGDKPGTTGDKLQIQDADHTPV